MRILITGSRDWDEPSIIAFALEEAVPLMEPAPIVLVSGACPTGADRMCEDYAYQNINSGWEVERHPAQWYVNGVYSKRAGFVRNAKMVELGADVCLAFIKNKSKGATMTANLAENAGIPTRRYEI